MSPSEGPPQTDTCVPDKTSGTEPSHIRIAFSAEIPTPLPDSPLCQAQNAINVPGDSTPPLSARQTTYWATYFRKWRGLGKRSPPTAALADVFWSFIGSFVAIGIISALTYNVLEVSSNPSFVLVVGSMGASAVLVYAVPEAALSQPRNVIGGHILSAFIGVVIRVLILDLACSTATPCRWFACALSVSLSIALMQMTGTLHPPGGATALIAATADPGIRSLGWWFILFPATIGSVVMVAVGVLLNNFACDRHYPQRWM